MSWWEKNNNSNRKKERGKNNDSDAKIESSNPFKEKYNLDRERNQRFYQSERWKRLRLHKLSLDPLCEICLENNIIEAANEVHHTINVNTQRGWQHRYAIDTLQSLCKSCHSRMTIEEMKERRVVEIENRMNELDDF